MDEHGRTELQPSVTNTMAAIGNIQRSSIRSYSCSAHRSERGKSGIWSNRKLVSVIGEVAMNVRYDHGALANS